MACLPNIINIISLDFSGPNDSGNWTNTSSFPILQTDGKLVLRASSIASTFTRILGIADPTNNRIRIRCNFILDTLGISGPQNAEVNFNLIAGGNVIAESCAEITEIADQLYYFNLDRVFNFTVLPVGNISLQIQLPVGWQYEVQLVDFEAESFFFCQDNIKTYFIIEELIERSLTAVSAGIKLNSWKVDGAETLTPAFFSENPTVGGNPLADWLFASADIDGANRESDDITPNSFNPFFDEWGMDFANVAGNYYGGQTLGPISGSNYGPAILGIGIDKPAVLNGELDSKDGAFFINIDYEKNLEIQFDVLINQASTNPYLNPTYYRSYFIKFDKDFCRTEFYYLDQLQSGLEVDAINYGFLSGITDQKIEETVVTCDEAFSPTGASGNFSFRLELGSAIGDSGIIYNAYGVPDRFIVNYDGVDYDTGFVGLDTYDAQLLAAGVAPGDINTTPSPGNGNGTLTFPKPNPSPTFATVTVEAPLGGTAWQVTGICPAPAVPPVAPTLVFNTTTPSINPGSTASFTINATPGTGSLVNWQIDWNDGSPLQTGIGAPPTSITHRYNTAGNFTPLMTIFASDALIAFDDAPLSVVAPALEVLNTFSNTCNSCLEFEVFVPTGSSYTLDVTAQFESVALYGASFCDPGGGSVGISADIVGQVLTPGTYKFHTGIDAAQGNPNDFNSNIFIRIKDGGSTIGTYNLNRSHSSNIC